MRKLLEISYEWTLDNTWLISMAESFERIAQKKVTVYNNILDLPLRIGTGKMYHWDIEDGIAAAYWECVFHETIQFNHLPANDHDYYTFFIDFAKDTNTVAYNGKTTRLGLRGNHTVYCSSSKDNVEYYARYKRPVKVMAITVDKKYFERGSEYDQVDKNKVIDWLHFDNFAKINEEILMNLVNVRLHINRDNVSILYLKGKIFYILSLLLDLFANKKVNNKKLSLEEVKQLFLLNKSIERDYFKPLPDIQTLAAELNMSESKFKKIFKEVYNNTYYQYHMDQRLLISKELLRQKHVSISDIALQIGYSNPSHFSRVFKKKFGISPMHYFERHTNNIDS